MFKDNLGDRMKHNYEEVSKSRLTRRTPVIIRLDGCHFHTFTKGFKKPFDEVLMTAMQETMRYLCKNIQGCVLGYTQSDEITLVLVDYQKLESQAWFDYEVQKMCSVSASMATLAFNNYFRAEVNKVTSGKSTEEMPKEWKAYFTARDKGAIFDARCFNIPKEEVCNCLFWRQKDAERNSINSLAQSLFPHKELQGLNIHDTLDKMMNEKGVYWQNCTNTEKFGSCCIKRDDIGWVIDNNIPLFKDGGRKYIEDLIFVGEDAAAVLTILDKLAEKPNRVLYPDGDLSSGLISPEDIKKWVNEHPEIKKLANKA